MDGPEISLIQSMGVPEIRFPLPSRAALLGQGARSVFPEASWPLLSISPATLLLMPPTRVSRSRYESKGCSIGESVPRSFSLPLAHQASRSQLWFTSMLKPVVMMSTRLGGVMS